MATASCMTFLISKYLVSLKKLWWEENWLDTFGCPLEPTTFIAIPMRPTGFSLDGRTNPVAMNGDGYSYYSEGMEVSQVSVSILGSGHVQGASKWTPFEAKGLCVHCQHRNGFPVVDEWKLSESCMTESPLCPKPESSHFDDWNFHVRKLQTEIPDGSSIGSTPMSLNAPSGIH